MELNKEFSVDNVRKVSCVEKKAKKNHWFNSICKETVSNRNELRKVV